MTKAYPTLAERKLARQRETDEAVRSLEQALTAFARDKGGRYILFGSAATGRMAEHSDIDLIVDFPDEFRSEALAFAEDENWKRGLLPDVRPRDYCSDALIADAVETGKILS